MLRVRHLGSVVNFLPHLFHGADPSPCPRVTRGFRAPRGRWRAAGRTLPSKLSGACRQRGSAGLSGAFGVSVGGTVPRGRWTGLTVRLLSSDKALFFSLMVSPIFKKDLLIHETRREGEAGSLRGTQCRLDHALSRPVPLSFDKFLHLAQTFIKV